MRFALTVQELRYGNKPQRFGNLSATTSTILASAANQIGVLAAASILSGGDRYHQAI
jgi:hypothetical protein